MKQVLITIASLAIKLPQSIINYQKLFSKYRMIILLTLVCLTVSSCHKDDNHVKKTVPLKGEFVIIDVGQSDSTHEQYNGTGEGTPIGKSTFVSFVYFVNFPLVTGTQTLFSGNGDQIFSTFSGIVPDPVNDTLHITNYDIITGGTGRFAGATGRFTAHGIANTKLPPEAPGTITIDGTITY